MSLNSPLTAVPTKAPSRAISKEKHFETVYNRYYWKIYGICRRYSAKPDDAQDLTHDVFARYFQHFDSFRNEASPSTWMYRVAVNLGIVRWRKERVENRVDAELETLPDGGEDLETALLNRIAVGKILGRFPEPMRKIILLKHYDKLTQMEISRQLCISRATVARKLHLFKHSCRSKLKPASRTSSRRRPA